MEDIIVRIGALLANTPPSEIEEFEVTRCLRDCREEIERLRTQGNGLADRVGGLFRETQDLYRHIATQQSWIPVSERLRITDEEREAVAAVTSNYQRLCDEYGPNDDDLATLATLRGLLER
jgi:hypothetical protein